MNLLTILLQAEGAAPAQGGSSWSFLIMMLLIFVVFYFFMIRPQSKRQKELKKQRDAMKSGDKVVTSGGIYGKVKDVKDNAVIIEIAENVRIKVDKNSVYVTAEDIQTQENKPA
ncbi:preprotein translocase subunit YajC [Paludibacteraceae bacterium OttesenSCG-928-F17]|nr:preprotein translocase subunit YajC [Paludibacteraceae bacterium OttesenSCG-928-F17]